MDVAAGVEGDAADVAKASQPDGPVREVRRSAGDCRDHSRRGDPADAGVHVVGNKDIAARLVLDRDRVEERRGRPGAVSRPGNAAPGQDRHGEGPARQRQLADLVLRVECNVATRAIGPDPQPE